MSTDIQPTGQPFSPLGHCDFGGFTYEYGDGRTETTPRCAKPPTHRFHPRGSVEGHWSYRCAEHAAVLSAGIAVERLTETGGQP